MSMMMILSVHQSIYPSMCVQSPTRCCATWLCVSRRLRSVRTTVRTAVISMQDMLMTATARPMRGTARRRGAKPTPGGRSTWLNQPSSASSNSPTPQTPTKVAYVPPSPPTPGSQILSLTRQWRSQKFSTGGAPICSFPFCPFPFSCPTKSAVQSKKRHDISYRLND